MVNNVGDYHDNQIHGDHIHVLGDYIHQAFFHLHFTIGSVSQQSEVFEHVREAFSTLNVAHSSARAHTNQSATAQVVIDAYYTSALHSIIEVRMMISMIHTMHHRMISCSPYLMETLADLRRILCWTELVAEAYHHTSLSESISRAISVKVEDCRRLLQELLHKLSGWRRFLSRTVLSFIQNYVCGRIGRSETADMLDLKLRECHKSFAACLLALGR